MRKKASFLFTSSQEDGFLSQACERIFRTAAGMSLLDEVYLRHRAAE